MLVGIFQLTSFTKIGSWTGQIWPLSHSLLFPPLTYSYFTMEFVSLILGEIQYIKGNNLQRDFKEKVLEKIHWLLMFPVYCVSRAKIRRISCQNPNNLSVIIDKTMTK